MFYALTDTFTGDNPREYTAGFANTKEVLAFETRAARDAWLLETRLLTAGALTRKQALQYAEVCRSDYMRGAEYGDKVARIYSASEAPNYHVIRKSRSQY